MKKYKDKSTDKDIDLEDAAFFLITAIDNLTKELERARNDR